MLVGDQSISMVLLLFVFLGLPPLLLWLGLLSLCGGVVSWLLLVLTLVVRHLALRLLQVNVGLDEENALADGQ